jgi:DNA-binding transcriptional ArsR family regulator
VALRGEDDVSKYLSSDLAEMDLNEMAPENRKFLIRNELRKLVRKQPDEGVTVRELTKATDLSSTTVRNHLEKLCDLREVYKQKRNDQLYIYYPNGKPLHGIGSEKIEIDDTIIEIQLAKGRDDKLQFHVLEKKFTLLEGETTEGAIMFPRGALDEFFDKLNSLANEVE